MCEMRKSSLVGKITVVVVICFFGLPAQAKYGGGTGEPNDPYLINTTDHMWAIGANPGDWNKCFKLMADMDLSMPPPPPPPPMLTAESDLAGFTGTNFNIIGNYANYFTGVFDGNGHKISNFNYTATDKSYIGLFGCVAGENAEIRNLGLVAPYVNTGKGRYIASLVGLLRKGKITNCYVEGGSVAGDNYVGGMVGENKRGTLADCSSTGSVIGNWHVGGLVGENALGTITDCSSTGTVFGEHQIGGLVGYNYGDVPNSYSTGSVIGNGPVGGLVGENEVTITNCYSTCSVKGNGTAGGLVGYDYYGTITNCYNMAAVSGTTDVGGMVGYNSSGTITNCYSTGSVIGNGPVGGLVGSGYFATITNCYAAGTVTGTSSLGGLLGHNVWQGSEIIDSFWDIETSGQTISDGGIGKTTARMQMASTFIVWGCESVWTIDEGNDYPRFWWENKPGEPITSPSYGGGSGEPNDPYLIYTAEHLNTIGLIPCALDKHFMLISDIDMSGYTGSSFNIIGTWENPFKGIFDGNGHTISNFTYISTSTGTDYIGLFGYVGGWEERVEIKNLGLIGPNIDAGTSGAVGSLVSVLSNGTITNCYVEGGSVSGGHDVGGLVGSNGGTITNCYSNVGVSGNYYVGGLVGMNGGWVSGTITNCYSTGTVSGTTNVGGLVGNNVGNVIASFWDIENSGQVDSAAGEGKTTAQMHDPNTYIGWGCGSGWTIDVGKDYPRLWWENMPGEVITNPSYWKGNGTGTSPFLIYTAEQLNTIGSVVCEWDKHFLLCADLDLSDFTGTSFNIIGNMSNPFTGIFDGSGHTISNLRYISASKQPIGLFGYVTGQIKNLGLIDPNVNAETGSDVGLLVGNLGEGIITNCYAEGGKVSGFSDVGGLVGFNRGTISNCYSTAGVSRSGLFFGGVGGLVGYNYYGKISECYSTGSVEGDDRVGGLVGYNSHGTITNCYSTGCVGGVKYVGGLVGESYHGTITNCYSTGTVTGTSNLGGLMGSNMVGTSEIIASFWDIETSGQTASDGGTGLPSEQMQTMSTFTDAGWDFVAEPVNGIEDIWFIGQQDYPHLWWEGIQVLMKMTPVSLNCRSEGNWVKAHINLPEGFTVADVDPDRPAVLHSFGFQSATLYVFVNKNKLVEIEAAFERQAVCSLAGDWPQALTVAGFLADGNIFLGTSAVRIKHPGMKVIEELASCWLQEDCVYPETDMNRDSLINLPDYALFMNINVEFVTDE